MRQAPPDATAAPTRISQPRPTQEHGTYNRFRRRSVTADAELFDMPRVGEVARRPRTAMPTVALVLDAALAATATVVLQSERLILAPAAAVVTVLLVGVLGGYRPSDSMTADGMSELRNLGLAAILATWIVTLVDLALGENVSAAGSIAMVCVLASGLVAVRALLRLRRPAHRERVVVIGSGGPLAGSWTSRLAIRSAASRSSACSTTAPARASEAIHRWSGACSRLPALLSRGEVDRVVVALGTADDAAVLRVLRKCDPFGVPVDVLPRFFELIGHRARRYRIGTTPMLTINGHAECVLQRHVKRWFDVAAAATILLLTALPCLVDRRVIKRHDHGPVLFRQRRIGKDGKPFDELKFRDHGRRRRSGRDERIAGIDGVNMTVADAVTALKPHDDPRVTRVGRVLRASSLDELPQLVNVLKGDMSLVGPRPLRDFEVDSLAGWSAIG